MRAGRSLRLTGWGLFTAVILIVYGVPVVMLLATSLRTAFFTTGDGTWSAEAYPGVVTDPDVHTAAGNTAILAAASTLIGISMALFFAFVSTRTHTRLKSLITPTMLFLFAMPALFLALSWGMLGTPSVGLLNVVLDQLTGLGAEHINIYSWPGLIWVTSLKTMAFTYLLIIGPMRSLSRTLEEASLISGASRLTTFFRTQIPLLSPVLLSALILSFVAGIEAFDIPLIIGVPIGVDVVSTQIFGFMTDQSPPGYAQATALAVLIVAIMVLLVVLQWRIIAKRSFVSITGKSAGAGVWHLGRAQWLMSVAAVGLFLLGCVLPLTQLVLGAFSSFFGAYGGYTLANFEQILGDDHTVQALVSTFALAVGGGFAAMVFAVAVTYILKRKSTLPKRLLELPTWTPFAMPGIILALALIGTVIVVRPLSPLFGTVWLMLIALTIAYTPIAARAAEGGILQIGEELIEAAKLSGSSPTTAVRTVVVPLIRGSFLYGWFIVGVAITGNLQVPILLSTADTTTAAVLAYQYYTNGDVAVAAAMFCVVLLTFTLMLGVAGLAAAIARAVGRVHPAVAVKELVADPAGPPA